MHIWQIAFFFFVISFVYAAVGFGGGSSYLAILAICGWAIPEMKFTALVCNIVVVAGSTLLYARKGMLHYKKMLPLVITSVPLAYLGAKVKLSADTFFILLGISLIAAALLLWLQPAEKKQKEIKDQGTAAMLLNSGIGWAIGLLSGMVGIGGGIFLSPILHLMRWDIAKKIAATASFFILVNSISGIIALSTVAYSSINFSRILLLGIMGIGRRTGRQPFKHKGIAARNNKTAYRNIGFYCRLPDIARTLTFAPVIMVLNILAFGIARDTFGTRSLSLDGLEQPCTVLQLRSFLEDKYPALRALATYMIAVNKEYAGNEVLIQANDEIAIIPPVSGG